MVARPRRERALFAATDGDATVALGAAAALLEARAGEPPSADADAFVARWLRLPGRLEPDPADADAEVVVLSARDVDFALRRAGLDRDPGWLGWRGRTVRFRFDGAEEALDGI
ncbi:MAG: hypothetical protein R3F59_03825 [Myxococcota bacterium]